MSTERTRAFRRAKLNRKKKRVLHYYNCPVKDARWIGRAAQTPKPCSCPMCGNPRTHFSKKTWQEIKANFDGDAFDRSVVAFEKEMMNTWLS